jgi:hypothetical protein
MPTWNSCTRHSSSFVVRIKEVKRRLQAHLTAEVVAPAKNSERPQFELVICTLASNCYTHFPLRAHPLFAVHAGRTRSSTRAGESRRRLGMLCLILGVRKELSRRGTPPTSPQHAYSPANQSIALGNNALVMHIQCKYYTAMLSPSFAMRSRTGASD